MSQRKAKPQAPKSLPKGNAHAARSTSSSRSSSLSSAPTRVEHVGASEELALLSHELALDDEKAGHGIITAPVMTRSAFVASGIPVKHAQYGVLGSVLAIREGSATYVPEDRRQYINTNAPFSALVCGVQGSGKSHTVSVLLESMLIPACPAIGVTKKPLCALVLHYGEGGPGARPCEAAWLAKCVKGIQATPPTVKVYVSRSSLATMKRVYAPLGGKVTVEPLLFSQSELDVQAILSMMAIGSSEGAPLYMHRILCILRDLGESFTYAKFLAQVELAKKDLNIAQVQGLEQRLVLLNTFVAEAAAQPTTRYKAGQLTIIDLSDPFVDPASASALFEIATRQFVRREVSTGKVLVVDEAHKYLSTNRGNSGLARQLTSLIRQQRHLAMRVVLSTQEPTAIPSVLIDLCSVVIMHRFSSPAWWEAVTKHVSASLVDNDAFDLVVKLKTGEAIVLAPSGLVTLPAALKAAPAKEADCRLMALGRRYILMKTRRRVTVDGGASRMVLDTGIRS